MDTYDLIVLVYSTLLLLLPGSNVECQNDVKLVLPTWRVLVNKSGPNKIRRRSCKNMYKGDKQALYQQKIGISSWVTSSDADEACYPEPPCRRCLITTPWVTRTKDLFVLQFVSMYGNWIKHYSTRSQRKLIFQSGDGTLNKPSPFLASANCLLTTLLEALTRYWVCEKWG